MVNKFEAIGIAISIGAMVIALWLVRLEATNNSFASISQTNETATVHVVGGSNQRAAVTDALLDATNSQGEIAKLVVDDVVIGEGEGVAEGDTVSVHYIGTLQNGQQFDNSYVKGKPFSFEVGKGRVIEGWEKGILGMKVGGQRILVIPSELAYGKNGAGPIPGNATLVFAIELLSVNE